MTEHIFDPITHMCTVCKVPELIDERQPTYCKGSVPYPESRSVNAAVNQFQEISTLCEAIKSLEMSPEMHLELSDRLVLLASWHARRALTKEIDRKGNKKG